MRVGAGVARADIQQIEFGIVGDAIPHGPAAAVLPGAVRIPALGSRGQFGIFEWLAGITRHGIEAPAQAAVCQRVSADIAAHVELAARIADYDHIAGNYRRAGTGVAALAIYNGVDFPDQLAIRGIERVQPAIEARDIHPARCDGDTAIDQVATGGPRHLHVERGLEAPVLRTAGRIQRVDAPGYATGIEHAVDHYRRCFHAAARTGAVFPGKPQPCNVGAIDSGQGRVVHAAPVSADGGPLCVLLLRRLRLTGAQRQHCDCQREAQLAHISSPSRPVAHRAGWSWSPGSSAAPRRHLHGRCPIA